MSSIRSCEIVSNLKNNEKILFDLEQMEAVLKTKKCIKKFAYIIHDSDEYVESDEQSNPEHAAGELKPEHIHLLLKFHKNQPQKIEYVAKWFGLGANFVQKIKSNWGDACRYLIHQNAPDKFQYEVENVNANFDYEGFIKSRSQQDDIDQILWRILDGDIREYNKTTQIDQLILVKHARKINDAFKVRSEHLQTNEQERSMTCFFITGDAGVGKTTLAKRIADEHQLPYYVSSGSNDVLDGYAQQPCLILDDMRPSSLGLSDLLKMLDPHTACSVKSRYKNKYLNCELVILTTVLDIDSFYRGVFSEEQEPVNQLKRRCQFHIRMDREIIRIEQWDQNLMRYAQTQAFKNELLDRLIPEKPLTRADVQESISELLPFLNPAAPDDEHEPMKTDYVLTPTGVYDEAKRRELSDKKISATSIIVSF